MKTVARHPFGSVPRLVAGAFLLWASLEAAAFALPGEPAPLEATAGPGASDLLTTIDQVGFDQHLGQALPLDLRFRDEAGRDVRLGSYFAERPVVLALVYHRCPMLCSLVVNGLVAALVPLELRPGREIEVVVVSFDPIDTPASAAAKKADTLRRYGHPDSEPGWHFLTGTPESIAALTQAVGFRYRWDPATQQFAHAAGIVVATADGRLARYFYGVEYSPRDLRLGLTEAADGRIGGLTEALLLLCFQYDPTMGRYTTVALLSLRGAAAATVLVLLGAIAWMVLRERRARRAPAGGTA